MRQIIQTYMEDCWPENSNYGVQDFTLSPMPFCFPTGHKILNTVDCTRPNGGRLPMKVALMMSDFAGGASGFPMTFSGGKFTGNYLYQNDAKELAWHFAKCCVNQYKDN